MSALTTMNADLGPIGYEIRQSGAGSREASRLRKVFGFCLALIGSVMLAAAPAAAAVKIQTVTSDKGITAWLVEDYAVPLVTIRFAFDGGSAQEPVGKEGMANLLAGLFDEGAGDLDSEAFQTKLDDVGAEMSFNASRDTISGSMRMLAEKKDDAFALLDLAVSRPRFDAPAVNRIRRQLVADIQSKARDPNYLAQARWLRALYGDHPYGRQDDGTSQTLGSVTQSDLQAFHKALFARNNLHVAVVGAIDAATLKTQLDALFGDLPPKADLKPVPDVKMALGQVIAVPYEQAETSIALAYPGIKRDDPGYFAAYLMNQVLGGSDFTSRLFQEVREKRGLTYGVTSALVNYVHADGLVVSTSTRPQKAGEALTVMDTVTAALAAQGPTQAELDAAKRDVIGSYAIGNLNSSVSIASTLLGLQINHLGIDYIERREALINAVTLDDVKAAASRLLTTKPAILVVGPKAEDLGKTAP